MRVPFLQKSEIAKEAREVLETYNVRTGIKVKPPIPVEDIIERGLDLRLDFIDFDRYPAMSDVLGATYVEKRLVCINQALLEDHLEGRFSFTCAHEIGHWALHRHYVACHGFQPKEGRRILCRTSQAKAPIEWQADTFASCLLMPEEMVRKAFKQTFGSSSIELVNVESSYAGPLCFDPSVANWPLIAESIIESGLFRNVSKQAMMIRLQDLQLVRNATSRPIGWARG